MVAISNEALEWLDRAEQAREVAGQLTDPGASRAVLQVADTFDRLARAAVARAVVRKEIANQKRGQDPRFLPSVAHSHTMCRSAGGREWASTGSRRRRGKRNGLRDWRPKSKIFLSPPTAAFATTG